MQLREDDVSLRRGLLAEPDDARTVRSRELLCDLSIKPESLPDGR